MTVPNLPYWLEPVHAEFETSGAISNAGRVARLPSQFWCSQFAGRSSLPKRLFHGMCNAMNDGNFAMQDNSIWGPGYTYVFEITACKESRPMIPTLMVVDWISPGVLNYYTDFGVVNNTDTAYNFYFPLQFENDGDINQVWVGVRDGNQFYFQMQEGRKHYNDGDLSCAIDVWVYKLGDHIKPTIGQTPPSDYQAAVAWGAKKYYPGASVNSTDWYFNPNNFSTMPAYVGSNLVTDTKLFKTYTVTVGKKYKITVKYTKDDKSVVNLGDSIVRIPDLSDLGLPYTTAYDPGGVGGCAMISYGSGYGGSGNFGAWVPFFFVVPPMSFAAGATTTIKSIMDLYITEIPD